jgi:hypothetical protein
MRKGGLSPITSNSSWQPHDWMRALGKPQKFSLLAQMPSPTGMHDSLALLIGNKIDNNPAPYILNKNRKYDV